MFVLLYIYVCGSLNDEQLEDGLLLMNEGEFKTAYPRSGAESVLSGLGGENVG